MLLSLDVQKKMPENDLYRYSVLFWSSFKVNQECVEDKRTFLRNDGYIESLFYFKMNCKAVFLSCCKLFAQVHANGYIFLCQERKTIKKTKTKKKNA